MADAFSVRGKNVVVTGGNRGIGLGISRAFAQSGANVAVLCRDASKFDIASLGEAADAQKLAVFSCDISDHASVVAAAAQVFALFGTIDVLVNNAGVATTTALLSEHGLDEWHRVINTNLHGTANVVHEFAPNIRDSGRGGSIINITSIGAQRVSNARDHENAPYHVSKAGLDIFTRYLAVVLGDYGVRVNAIAPGPTHSDLDKDLPPSAMAKIESDMPAHRFGEPLEIGALCVYLASPAGNQVTGQIIAHDGGMLSVT
jgi:NAD(P)-dependent dehydrogenase (short-subunit alcohol dehydrogenase family)